MSRYYTPVSAQPERPFWKSPAILGAIALGFGVAAASIAMEFTTQSAIHIRADDNSESAAGEALQRQVHCQASSHNYKPGDTVISIAFADRPVVSQKLTVFNSLSLLGKCQQSDREIKNKRPGTSLILLLERIPGIIQEQRSQNNLNPAVATILIDDAEPGPDQPELNFDRVKTLVDDIAQKRGVVAIMVPPGELQEQLETHLQGKASICPVNRGKDESEVRLSIVPCVDSAFARARQISAK